MTNSYTLTTIDTTSIQNYIFGSNRLRENVGASALVEQATADWVLEIIEKLVTRHNINPSFTGATLYQRMDWMRWIERDNLQAEVLYSGGGNTVILFADRKDAIAFVTKYTRHLLEQAPGLEVACVHQTVTWDAPQGNLRDTLRETGTLLTQKKAIRPLPTPILGLGVTAECESTGLPATNFDPLYREVIEPDRQRYRPVSSTIFAKAKRETQEWSRQRLEALFPAFRATKVDCDFWYNPDDTNDLLDEKEGEGQYIAVVHADGNRMGERFQMILRRKQATDRDALQLLRQLSAAVDHAGRQAMKALGDQLATLVGPVEKGKPSEQGKRYLRFFEPDKRGRYSLDWEIQLGYNKKRDKFVIPFRPLIYGGDDVTFVCDGRLGLTLATLYLNSFEDTIAQELAGAENDTLRNLLQGEGMAKIYACAGVAIVKLHYPFSRAYLLAEELCKSAKAYVRDDEDRKDFSALDWHFAAGGLYGSIGLIRKREYQTSEGSLTMRPMHLRKPPNLDKWRNWPNFVVALKTFEAHDDWREKQNKVIQLRDALRKGPSAVKAYLLAYKLQQLPMLAPSHEELQSEGWTHDMNIKRCGHFDVIEALEFYLPIQEETEK